MNQDIQIAQDLISFIDNSPSMFQVIDNCICKLEKAGYKYLCLTEKWEIKEGGKYYTTRNESSIFAFFIGDDNLEKSGMRIISAHSDSPGFKVKPSPDMFTEDIYVKLNTEVYGGPILSTWMDRPLSVAGRVILKSENVFSPIQRKIKIDKPLLVIPNLAIHLNREVNNGIELNKQIDLLPLLSSVNEEFEKENYLLSQVAQELNVSMDQIIDFDLFLFPFEKGSLVGANSEFISCPKLDDLAMVHAGLDALIEAENTNTNNFLCIFDNEEVGSGTKQGAGSPVFKNIISRIFETLGKSNEEMQRAIYSSFMISADMAHAIHPNKSDKHDPVLKPVLNGGPVIKYHANQKYTTDAESAAVFAGLCDKINVPYQRFANRSDMQGGSTLGNVLISQIDVKSVDIGNPMLSMHSVRELSGVKDHAYIIKVFKEFFSC